jgi:hypothetical protein
MTTAVTQSLEELHGTLATQLTWVCAKWGEFKKLFAVSEADVDLLNRSAPDVFVLTQEAMLSDILLGVCRLTDDPSMGRNENLSIGRLAQHPEILAVPELSVELSTLVADARDRASFARERRNKRIAHHDLPTALQPDVVPIAPYGRRNIEAVIEALVEVLNVVERHLTGRTGYYGEVAGFGDSHRLFRILRAGLDAEDDERRRWGIPDPDR